MTINIIFGIHLEDASEGDIKIIDSDPDFIRFQMGNITIVGFERTLQKFEGDIGIFDNVIVPNQGSIRRLENLGFNLGFVVEPKTYVFGDEEPEEGDENIEPSEPEVIAAKPDARVPHPNNSSKVK